MTSRREVFRAASAIGLAGVMGSAGPVVQAAPGRGKVTTFVFVGGANGSSSGDSELGMLGHRTIGVELPGSGAESAQFRRSYQAPQDLAALAQDPSPVAGVTLDDYADRTVDVVRRVAQHGPVVLFGGSMGGATISRVGNRVPELISRVVYDSAFCCVDLASCNDYLATPEGSTSLMLDPDIGRGVVGDPSQLGALRMNWRSADPAFLDAVKAANMAEASDAEFLAMLNSLRPDESMEVGQAEARGEASSWGRIPRTYIRHTLDRHIPLALQDRMIREADALTPRNPFGVHTVETSHAATARGWREIVRILHGLAGA